MPLLNFPNELLLLVAEELVPNAKDLKNFLSVNRRLYFLLFGRLHRLAADDQDGQPALHWAVKEGYMPLVLLLLESGVDLNARETKTRLKKTALHCAAELGSKTMVATLLERGASINLQDNNGRSALAKATVLRHFSVVQVLLENGADANLQDNEGVTALHHAIYATRGFSNDTKPLINLLVSKGAAIDHQDCNNITPLYLAMSRNHNSIVKLLLEHGANLFLQRNRGYDVVHRAVMNNDIEMVKLLLEQQGMDINHQDEDGKTVLYFAASLTIRGQTWDLEPIIRLLISKGSDVSIKDNQGSRPLIFAKYATEGIRKLLGYHGGPAAHSHNSRRVEDLTEA